MVAPNTSSTAASALPTAGGTSVGTLSNWAAPYATNILGKAQAIADRPYETYQGPMTAGESGLQSKVFQGLGGLSFPSNLGKSFSSADAPAIPPAGSTGAIGGAPTGIAAQYMNPYLQAVLNPQMEELRRQSQINLQPGLAKLTQAGGFGGGRQAIMESEAARNLMQEQNKTVGQGYASAYDRGLAQFNTEQGQAKDLTNMMANLGNVQRGIEQEGVTADYNEFLAQRDYPKLQTQYMQSMLQGMPISSTTNEPLSKSGIGQLVEAFGGMTQLEDALKKFKLV